MVWLCACLVYEILFIVKSFFVFSLVTAIMVYEYFTDVSSLLSRLQNGQPVMKLVNFLTENLKHATNEPELL